MAAWPPHDPHPDRDFWLIALLLGLGGGISRLLYTWDAQRNVVRMIGAVCTSMFVAVVVGLALYEQLVEHPSALLAVIGAAAWLGGDLVEQIARRIVERHKL